MTLAVGIDWLVGQAVRWPKPAGETATMFNARAVAGSLRYHRPWFDREYRRSCEKEAVNVTGLERP